MEAFGIIGMSLGSTAFVFALNTLNRIAALEKRLEEAGVLEAEKKPD